MMHKDYLTLARNDLLSRLNGGSILINDSVSVPVQGAVISTHPIVGFQNAIALQVQALHVDSVPLINNLKLLTSDGVVVAEKVTQIGMNGSQFLTLTFVVQVKGGV
ncbi:hypothetical protein LOK74_19050 [Brevibacillus humidisoli]|uniref:hypothetical protein n=1 Tax=Brevibacillus humidisoli TaxID=2895522 RepID=UPI001E4FFC9F|nr:hypothetical protein [Brevibacillus humidisoli]UFJ40112.1 hypothetical protein LOK74_19050 [Brevibacillus humidisoli]